MQTQRIELGLLRASAQPRPLITADVDKLAASIREIGLINPITVRPAVVGYKGLSEQGFQIIAGHHRVAAARALGWTEIDAIVKESRGHLQSELIEIDENLVRSELTPVQHDYYTARRKEVWDALHPWDGKSISYEEQAAEIEVARLDAEPSRDYSLESYDGEGEEIQVGKVCPPELGYKKPPPQTKGFAAATAEVTGESKRAINLSLARAEAIGPDLLRLTGTSLDKGVELTALAKLPEPERKDLIERAAAGEKVTARTPAPAPAPAPTPPAPPPAPAQPPVADLLDSAATTEDAEFFIKEVRLFLDKVRDGLCCKTNDDAARLVRDALHTAPESVFARYSEASTALEGFLDIVASGNE